MANNSIDDNLITQFSDMLHVKAQQINARLRRFVTVQPMIGDDFAYDGLGDVEAREVNGRVVPTVFDDIEHNRRRIKRRRFVVTLPVDASDVRGTLINPQGEYAAACIRAMARVFDRVGIEAAFADISTGRLFDTTVTFANDGGVTVDATGGYTYEKLLEILENFTNNEVGNDIPEQLIILQTGTEQTALMQETELTSGDFTRQFAVEGGRMVNAVGIDLIHYGASVVNPLLAVTAGTRDNIAMAARGLRYGLSKEMSVTIKDRSDHVEVVQVQTIGQLGAVRTEGVLIQKLQTTS